MRTLRTIKRSNKALKASSLPLVINLNPRSAYGKEKEIETLVKEMNCGVLTISESWNREEYPLEELLQIENYKVITNVRERERW